MSERLERLDADQRFMRMWALGGVLHDASRDLRIAAAQDWAYLLVPADALTRQVYETLQERMKPLSGVTGYINGHPFAVTQEALHALWAADSRRAN